MTQTQMHEFAQHGQGRQKIIARTIVVKEAPRGEFRNRRGNRGACKKEVPGHVHPEHEHGDRHEGAVDVGERSGRHPHAEKLLDDQAADAYDSAAHERVAEMHPTRRHELVDHGKAQCLQNHLSDVVERL